MKLPVIVIVGPTAVGKTEISIDLAERVNAEIVSADSRQLFRFMDIGTAKPDKTQLSKVKHHFISILDPDSHYTAGDYSRDARNKIYELLNAGKNVIVVGGSGLYLRALLKGIITINIKNRGIKETLIKTLNEKGLPFLYNELTTVDPALAGRLSPNDRQRILRGLEVFMASGKRLSELQLEQEEAAAFPYVQIGLNRNRKELYQKIDNRVVKMIENGLVEEVRDLKAKGYSQYNAFNTVGYKETLLFLNNRIDLNSMIELIQRNTRRYAKRQLTWFNKVDDINWFNIPDENLIDKILLLVKQNQRGL